MWRKARIKALTTQVANLKRKVAWLSSSKAVMSFETRTGVSKVLTRLAASGDQQDAELLKSWNAWVSDTRKAKATAPA